MRKLEKTKSVSFPVLVLAWVLISHIPTFGRIGAVWAFFSSFFLSPVESGGKRGERTKKSFCLFPSFRECCRKRRRSNLAEWQRFAGGGSRGGGKRGKRRRRRRRFLLLPSSPFLEKSKYVIQQCRKQDFEIVMLYNTISETCILSVDISEYLLLGNFGPCVSAFESLFLLPLSLLPLPSLPSFFFEK